jgi:hypothetical protein
MTHSTSRAAGWPQIAFGMSSKLGDRLGSQGPKTIRVALQGEFDPFTQPRHQCTKEGLRGDHRPMLVGSALSRGAARRGGRAST